MHASTDGGPLRRPGKGDPKLLIGCGIGCLFLLFVVCAGGGGAGYWWYTTEADKKAKQAERQRILDALQPELSSYLEPAKNPLSKGKFKGKVVCIDTGAKKIDEESLDHLPDSLKATKPAEVGAVAKLIWREEEVSEYPDGSKAKRYVATVTLIDRAQSKPLAPPRVIEGDIQEKKFGSGDRTGPKPWGKIVDFLKEHQESN
jgi:hypothetical protein